MFSLPARNSNSFSRINDEFYDFCKLGLMAVAASVNSVIHCLSFIMEQCLAHNRSLQTVVENLLWKLWFANWASSTWLQERYLWAVCALGVITRRWIYCCWGDGSRLLGGSYPAPSPWYQERHPALAPPSGKLLPCSHCLREPVKE